MRMLLLHVFIGSFFLSLGLCDTSLASGGRLQSMSNFRHIPTREELISYKESLLCSIEIIRNLKTDDLFIQKMQLILDKHGESSSSESKIDLPLLIEEAIRQKFSEQLQQKLWRKALDVVVMGVSGAVFHAWSLEKNKTALEFLEGAQSGAEEKVIQVEEDIAKRK